MFNCVTQFTKDDQEWCVSFSEISLACCKVSVWGVNHWISALVVAFIFAAHVCSATFSHLPPCSFQCRLIYHVKAGHLTPSWIHKGVELKHSAVTCIHPLWLRAWPKHGLCRCCWLALKPSNATSFYQHTAVNAKVDENMRKHCDTNEPTGGHIHGYTAFML